MRMLACAVLALAAADNARAAEERYDRSLAAAAAEIVAARMGELRGGFVPGERPRLMEPGAPRPAEWARKPRAAASGPVWVNGLAVAVEREPAASPEL